MSTQEEILGEIGNMGGNLDTLIDLDSKMSALIAQIDKIDTSTAVSLVCGFTGTGKSTLLSYLSDPSSLAIKNKDEEEEEEEDEDEEKIKFEIKGKIVTKEQRDFYDENGWIVLDSDKFRVGHNLDSTTVLPNFGEIQVNDNQTLICFDLAGFADNRGFSIQVVIDAVLAHILSRFKFRRLICLCSSSLFKDKNYGSKLLSLKDTLEACGLVDVLQLVIVRYESKVLKTVTYPKWLEKCRQNVKPKITEESKMQESLKTCYEYFSKHVDNALFLSYKHFADESRKEILEKATTGDPFTPTIVYSFSPETKRLIADFFDKLNGLLVTDTTNKLLELAKMIPLTEGNLKNARDDVARMEKTKNNLENNKQELKTSLLNLSKDAKEFANEREYVMKMIKQCEERLLLSRQSKNSYENEKDQIKRQLDSEKRVMEANVRRLSEANSELYLLVKKGEECIVLANHDQESIPYQKRYSISCNSDKIVCTTWAPIIKCTWEERDVIKSSDTSGITVVNKNTVFNAKMKITFLGRRDYVRAYKNDLAVAERKVRECSNELGLVRNRVEILDKESLEIELQFKYYRDQTDRLQKELDDIRNQRNITTSREELTKKREKQIEEDLQRKTNELAEIERKLTHARSQIRGYETELKDNQRVFLQMKELYFNDVLKQVYRIKMSEIFKGELEKLPVYRQFCANFERLANEVFRKELAECKS